MEWIVRLLAFRMVAVVKRNCGMEHESGCSWPQASTPPSNGRRGMPAVAALMNGFRPAVLFPCGGLDIRPEPAYSIRNPVDPLPCVRIEGGFPPGCHLKLSDMIGRLALTDDVPR